MKKLLLLLVLGLTAQAFGNVYILTGKDLSNFEREEINITTKQQEVFFKNYDYTCDVGDTAYHLNVKVNDSKITLKVGCTSSNVYGNFVQNVLFNVIDSPNIMQCKLSSSCSYDINGNEHCGHTFGSLVRTEYLYVSTGFENYASSLENRYKETECR